MPRSLTEKDGDIFKIIMTWVDEQKEEKKIASD
jgi:ferritin